MERAVRAGRGGARRRGPGGPGPYLQAAALAPGEGRPRVPAQRQQQLVDHPAARRRAGCWEPRKGRREGRARAAASAAPGGSGESAGAAGRPAGAGRSALGARWRAAGGRLSKVGGCGGKCWSGRSLPGRQRIRSLPG